MKIQKAAFLPIAMLMIVFSPHAIHHERLIIAETMIAKKTAPIRKVLPEEERQRVNRLAALPVSDLESVFTPPIVQRPQELCATIATGDGTTIWAESEIFTGEWECWSERLADQSEGNSIFAMVRGPSQNNVKFIRLKLSIVDEEQREGSIEQFYKILNSLFEISGLELPENMQNVPATGMPFKSAQSGFEIRFFRERTESERYNFSLSWPSRYTESVPGSSERFEPANLNP